MSDGGGVAYDGSDGTDLGIGEYQVAANPAAMTWAGEVIGDITMQPMSELAADVQAVLNTIASLIGITPAVAGGIITSWGATIGYLSIPKGIGLSQVQTGANLATMLTIMNAQLMRDGVISYNGVTIGFVDPAILNANTMRSARSLSIDDTTIDGPFDVDSTYTGYEVTINGVTATMGGLTPGLWMQATNIGGAPIQPGPAVMGFGANTSEAVMIMDSNNAAAMWQGKDAWLINGAVAGKDGVYSLRTTKRLAPRANFGAPAAGFNVGKPATFARNFLLYGWTAQGYTAIVGSSAELAQLIDPTTNAVPNIVYWTYVSVWDGSRRVSLLPSMVGADAYNGPAPTLAAPDYGAGETSPVLALTSLISNISTVVSPAVYTPGQGGNPGGTEGPNG